MSARVSLPHWLVPRAVRHGLSARLAEMQARRLERDLAALATGAATIVVGPWLGEVGFELLYWVPFLRWFAATYNVAPERLLIVSRGGTASWYQPFAAGYREIFDYWAPEEFRRRHDERVHANGEQKQTQVLLFERQLLRELADDVRDRVMLHPSSMYGLFSPFWWGHVGEAWVHRHASYQRLVPPVLDGVTLPAEPYTAVKFYFNECFPATDENRAFVKATLETLLARGPVVSLTTGLHLDDHSGYEGYPSGVLPLPPHVGPAQNLAVQTAVVGGASAFVGTYGGFSYLAPFLGVPSTACYSHRGGFSERHLVMARSALSSMGAASSLIVQAAPHVRSRTH
jgi:hypothetical protein